MTAQNRCARCDRRCRGQAGWNCTVVAGVIVALLCPACQTPEENAEAEINAATLDYARDTNDRFVGRARH